MAIDKSKWNTNVKVSQKTIDEIKKMGMTKALKTVAGASAASKNDASAKAWVEGVKRLYGSNRVADAIKSTPSAPKKSAASYPSPSSAGSNSAKPKAKTTSGPKSANTPAKSTRKVSTTSNPFTALHNAASPYGNKNQKYKSPTGAGLATRKSVPGKPSIGEQINSAIGSVGRALKPERMRPEQVRAEMKRREAAAKKKK